MIIETELEIQKLQYTMDMVSELLEEDEVRGEMKYEERMDLEREISILEVEYAQWINLFESRTGEKDDIQEVNA
jgi:hypothetical protein